jgi:hypothetical protein
MRMPRLSQAGPSTENKASIRSTKDAGIHWGQASGTEKDAMAYHGLVAVAFED